MNETRFYICEHCGNIIGKIYDAGVPVVCCGQKMTPLIPGTVEASHEKHIPVVSVRGGIVKVEVGSHVSGAPYRLGLSPDQQGRPAQGSGSYRRACCDLCPDGG